MKSHIELIWFYDDLDTEFEDCELVQPFAGYEEEMLDYFNDSSSDGGGDDTETEGCLFITINSTLMILFQKVFQTRSTINHFTGSFTCFRYLMISYLSK